MIKKKKAVTLNTLKQTNKQKPLGGILLLENNLLPVLIFCHMLGTL